MTQDSQATTADLEARCRAFVAATREFLRWEWDGRFLLMLSVCDANNRADVEALIDQCFPHKIGSDDKDLPTCARDVMGGIGGLRPRQFLYLTEVDRDPVMFCAWWPWGGGGKVSLRFGCWSAQLHGPGRAELRAAFQRWFA
jgi:hypothetical protein